VSTFTISCGLRLKGEGDDEVRVKARVGVRVNVRLEVWDRLG
jgi:hypothetical protein